MGTPFPFWAWSEAKFTPSSICCLDLEGVLMPELWIEVAAKTGIPELRITTREEPDYDRLMRRRLRILRRNSLKLRDIQKVIEKIDPLPGARAPDLHQA